MEYSALRPFRIGRGRSMLVAAALTGALLAPGSLGSFAPQAPDPVRSGRAMEQQDPSIQAQEMAAHARDGRVFTPGDAVDVAFVPLPDDTWDVDGAAPRPLPAARASGRDIALEQTGETWASAAGGRDSDDIAGGAAGAAGDGATAPALGPSIELASFVGSRKQVIGFMPYWQLDSPVNYKVVTTVAYFAVDADRYGNLCKTSGGALTPGWAGWASSDWTRHMNAAHANGDRAVLTVTMFAWDSAGAATQAAFLNSSAAQLNLAKQIAAAVRDRGADGVNIDFEPIVAGGGPGFAAFIRTLRAQLNAVAAGYQLTLDATGYVGNYPLARLQSDGAVDAVLVMGYDFRTAASGAAGSIDPRPSAYVYDLEDAIGAFTSKMSPSKIILGLPWYGRAWSTTSSALHAATRSSGTYGWSTVATYDVAASIGAQYGTRYDSAENSAWAAYYGTWGTTPTWRQLYWDNPKAEAVKADLIVSRGLRGAGIWALGYDGGRSDLYNVLAAKFPATTSVSFSYPPAGTTRIVTSTSARISWAIGAPAGIRSVSLLEQYGKRVLAGSCASVTWQNVWTRTGQTSPLSLTSLGTNFCYRWKISVTDGAGKTVSAWSGSLLVATVPRITWSFPVAGKISTGGYANTILWSVSDPSGVASSSITEWYGRASAGSCSGIHWTSEWTDTYRSPLYSWGFLRGYCYHYLVKARSGNGVNSQSNSGTLYIP